MIQMSIDNATVMLAKSEWQLNPSATIGKTGEFRLVWVQRGGKEQAATYSNHLALDLNCP